MTRKRKTTILHFVVDTQTGASYEQKSAKESREKSARANHRIAEGYDKKEATKELSR